MRDRLRERGAHSQVVHRCALPIDPLAVVGQEAARRDAGCGRGCAERAFDVARRGRGLGLLDRRGEGFEVDRGVGRKEQLVGARGRDQGRRAVEAGLGQEPAQARDHRAERRRPRIGQLLRPQQLGELLPPNRAVPLAHQEREDEPALATPEERVGQDPLVRFDLERSTHPHVEHVPKSREGTLALSWGPGLRLQRATNPVFVRSHQLS